MNTKHKIACLLLALAAGSAQAVDLRSWDRKIESARERFEVLTAFNNEAVLDKETQLVWERAPTETKMVWINAHYHCLKKAVGGRAGWRLPSVHELNSLVAPEADSRWKLPPDHPFSNVGLDFYWSGTNVDDTAAHSVRFMGHDVHGGVKQSSVAWHVWCVREPADSDYH